MPFTYTPSEPLPVTDDRLRHYADGSLVKFCSTECREDWYQDAIEDGRVWVHDLGRCANDGHLVPHRRGDKCKCWPTTVAPGRAGTAAYRTPSRTET